jgi:alpha-methylacyl-CoA racemase
MLLADMGAAVLRVGRKPTAADKADRDIMNRGKQSIGLDLKDPAGVSALLRLVESADAVLEGFRPGVAERLGVGPQECLARNPRVVYGRITGWGQRGPQAATAGHDINYIALSGVLSAIGRAGQPPTPPINLLGDYGGGGMLLAFGVVCGLLEARQSGRGQVIDAAMVDGAALLSTVLHTMRAGGEWTDERGTNLIDTGAPFYDVYMTADGEYVAVGCLEERFFRLLLDTLGLDGDELFAEQHDRARWPAMRDRFAAVFKERTRDEWHELFKDSDACVTPVLSMAEAPEYPHNKTRGTFVTAGDVLQPAPAPRFSRTPAEMPPAPPAQPCGDEVLLEWGLRAEEIRELHGLGVIT